MACPLSRLTLFAVASHLASHARATAATRIEVATHRGATMSTTFVIQLYVFVLAAFVGYQVITRVPPLLHTPLMSATNAISGISLVGSIVAAGGQYGRLATILGF